MYNITTFKRHRLDGQDGWLFAYEASGEDKVLIQRAVRNHFGGSDYVRIPEFNGVWLTEGAAGRMAELLPELQTRLGLGYHPSPSSRIVPIPVHHALKALRITPDADPDIVQAVFRVLSKRVHSDVGGSDLAMRALIKARDIALMWAERRAAWALI